MATTLRIPTANETPDSSQVVGDLAVTGPTNTGHASTQTVSADGGISTKSCRWHTFESFAGGATAITLKITHTTSGQLSGPGASNEFTLDYSINGGAGWVNALTRTNFTATQGPTVFSVALSTGQDVSQVQVRDLMEAVTLDVGEDSESNATISDIQLEITLPDGGVIFIR